MFWKRVLSVREKILLAMSVIVVLLGFCTFSSFCGDEILEIAFIRSTWELYYQYAA